MKEVRHKLCKYIMLAGILILSQKEEMCAAERDNLSTNSKKHEIVSVVMPTVDENDESPFDFIIDPQNLLFETNAILYGGGIVEENAHLLFHNRNGGEYDFSSQSDYLEVTNCGTSPVMIMITARMDDLGDITLLSNKEFSGNEERSIYLALVDSLGNEQPLSNEGEISLCVEIGQSPENVYSFGLTGECSVNGDWKDTIIQPRVTITWEVESVLSNDTVENVVDMGMEENENIEMEEIEKEGDTEDIFNENKGVDDMADTSRDGEEYETLF